SRQHVGTYPLDRLTDLDEAEADGVEHEPVVERPSLRVAPNRFDGTKDVGQPLVIVSTHSSIASDSASARTFGRRLSEGATSTCVPRTSEISRSSLPSVNSPVPGARSTSRSMSLSEVSSPQATLPNT